MRREHELRLHAPSHEAVAQCDEQPASRGGDSCVVDFEVRARRLEASLDAGCVVVVQDGETHVIELPEVGSPVAALASPPVQANDVTMTHGLCRHCGIDLVVWGPARCVVCGSMLEALPSCGDECGRDLAASN